MWDRPDHIPPGPCDRLRAIWLDDSSLSTAEAALRARATVAQASRVRRALVSYGVLPPLREPRRAFPAHVPLPPAPRDLQLGSCVGVFPSPWVSDDPAERQRAARICVADCPVQQACLDWSLAAIPISDTAIYGGFTGRQRAALARRRGIARPRVSGVPLIEARMTCCPACGLPLSGPNLITEPGRRPGTVRRRCRACTRRRKTADMRAYRAAAAARQAALPAQQEASAS